MNIEGNKNYFDQFEDSSHGIYVLDENRKIIHWNKKAEEITGYSKEEMLSHHCFQAGLDHMDDEGNHRCNMMCPMLLTIFDSEPRNKDLYLLNKEQTRVGVRIQTEALYDGDTIIGTIEYFDKL